MTITGFSQSAKVPKVIQDSFTRRYPTATDVKWENEMLYYSVRFKIDDTKMIAEYEGKGVWRNSRKDWTYEKLPTVILDAFKKTKYAEWPVNEVKIVSTPKDPELYRLTVGRDEFNRRNLYFNKTGRLVKDSFTL
jgi:hypothetical protein